MITVVNMVPNSLSGETAQDSEPSLAVNPHNPNWIVGTAFTPNPPGSSNAPIYVSTDGGNTWIQNPIVPSTLNSALGTGDITVAFTGDGTGRLYAGILRAGMGLQLGIFRTNNFQNPTAMTMLVNRAQVDQPIITNSRVYRGVGRGDDRLYVGHNDFGTAIAGQTASVDYSLDAVGAAPPPPANFQTTIIESRATPNQDGPQIRPAVHIDGTVYAVFYGRRSVSGIIRVQDVTVVRDDDWAQGAAPFSDLVDAADSLSGQRVALNRRVPWQNFAAMGQERTGGDLAIAIDPRNSDTVYICFAHRPTGTTQYNLYVRRSLDRGQTWSNDLRIVVNAKNPKLAINSRGRVAFIYQALTGTAPNQRWVTTLERTDDAFVTVMTDVLATVPSNAPGQTFLPYIGDYVGLEAWGKDFYGIFSANNTPDNANFPSGVTYQRNANFATNQLLANDGVTPVGISIDPFFFHAEELAADEDFYVADWTDGPTDFDLGAEPSIEPIFFNRSDVWNRRTNAPGGFNANNQPVNETPQHGTGGDNWAFCRIRRRATGSAAAVTAHFLISEFGTGSNYIDAGTAPDPVINFAPGDDSITMAQGYPWHLSATTSTHLCEAVEISTSNDPIIAPSVLGRAPGWPGTDLLFLNDNNKAQRNMGVGPEVLGLFFLKWAVIHNAATWWRNIVIDVTWNGNDRPAGTLFIVGERGRKLTRRQTRIELNEMAPGENRWIGIQMPVGREEGEQTEVDFAEIVDGKPLNGFSIASVAVPPQEAMAHHVDLHGSVATRAAALFDSDDFSRIADHAYELAGKRRITERAYRTLVAETLGSFGRLPRMSDIGRDPLGVSRAVSKAQEAAEAGSAELTAIHAEALNRADALLTMHQKAGGDVADIAQTFRLQIEVFGATAFRRTRYGQQAVDVATEFLTALIPGSFWRLVADYPDYVESSMGAFAAAARRYDDDELHHLLEQVAGALKLTPSALQRAHLAYALRLAKIIPD